MKRDPPLLHICERLLITYKIFPTVLSNVKLFNPGTKSASAFPTVFLKRPMILPVSVETAIKLRATTYLPRHFGYHTTSRPEEQTAKAQLNLLTAEFHTHQQKYLTSHWGTLKHFIFHNGMPQGMCLSAIYAVIHQDSRPHYF